MATIALYDSKINNMPSFFENMKSSVGNFKSDLNSLKSKCSKINVEVCNLEDVISTISSSTKLQEEKETSLDDFSDKIETFANEVEQIDANVADLINESKDDFYDEYYYLKPECEKDWLDKVGDGLESIGNWCKEHWKLIGTVLLVVAAVIIIVATAGTALTAFSLILVGVAKGVLMGAVVGGLVGGTLSAIRGDGFFKGFEDGAFSGAIAGALSGGLGSFFSSTVGTVTLTLRQTILIGGSSEAFASLIGDLGDILIKGEKISVGEVLFNTGLSFVMGGAFAFGGAKLGEWCKIKIPGINAGNGSWAHVWASQMRRSLNHGSIVSLKTIMKGLGSQFVDGLWDSILEIPKGILSDWLGYDNLIAEN